ncbi:MAG: hypothetical protein Q8P55_01735 [bacterium]|nr:hypothetical protein [bacterium]
MKQFFVSTLFVRLVIGVVVVAIGYGIFLVGSPTTQRSLQADQRRVSDLQQISFAIDEYWARNQKLPQTLEELQDSRYYFVESTADAITKNPYEYQVVAEKQYELCAVFVLSSADNRSSLRFPPSKVWEHEAERTCFELEVQPKLENVPAIIP